MEKLDNVLEMINELETIFQPDIECLAEPYATRVSELFVELRKSVTGYAQDQVFYEDYLKGVDSRLKAACATMDTNQK